MNKLSIDLSQCHGCGLCAGICPTDALSMKIENERYIPSFSIDKCTDCNICEKICNNHLNNSVVNENNENNFNPYIGHFSRCYIGYSTNLDIRKKSASGGLISTLLIYLLNSGKIDGAVITKLRYNGQRIETYPFIARTEKDILDASGSYYLPVNFSNIIKEIKKGNSETYAIVALPCAVSNLKDAIENFPFLTKIKYIFGLFCSHNFNYSILDYIKNKTKLNDHNIEYFNFRSGWPESVISIRTSERQYKLYAKYWNFLFNLKIFPMSDKCYVCNDCCAEFADISFGDAWLPSIKKADKIGTSVCISRTNQGEELLKSAINHEIISIYPTGSMDIIYSQRFPLYFKKIQASWFQKYKKDENKKMILPPQLLMTIPVTFCLNYFSNKFPDIMTRTPYIIYRILSYIIAVNIVTANMEKRKNV